MCVETFAVEDGNLLWVRG